MRRLLAWLGGVLGGIAVWRFFRRRRELAAVDAAPAPAEQADPRAEALRAKLDEVREAEPEVEPELPSEPEPGVEPATEPEPEPEPEPAPVGEAADPEERRRSVHEHGRAAVDEMRGGDGDESS